jgi:hypothetical protein
MDNASGLAETITKKQGLAEREEELTRKSMEDSINNQLKRYFERVPDDEFLEALRDQRYLYVCLKMPTFEDKTSRIGKMYMEAVNEILKQQNEKNPKCLLEVENDKTTIKYIIRSKKDKNCVGNTMNTVIIHVVGKEAGKEAEKKSPKAT